MRNMMQDCSGVLHAVIVVVNHTSTQHIIHTCDVHICVSMELHVD